MNELLIPDSVSFSDMFTLEFWGKSSIQFSIYYTIVPLDKAYEMPGLFMDSLFWWIFYAWITTSHYVTLQLIATGLAPVYRWPAAKRGPEERTLPKRMLPIRDFLSPLNLILYGVNYTEKEAKTIEQQGSERSLEKR